MKLMDLFETDRQRKLTKAEAALLTPEERLERKREQIKRSTAKRMADPEKRERRMEQIRRSTAKRKAKEKKLEEQSFLHAIIESLKLNFY